MRPSRLIAVLVFALLSTTSTRADEPSQIGARIGKLKFTDLTALAAKSGEPRQISGKQERYENLLNQYLMR